MKTSCFKTVDLIEPLKDFLTTQHLDLFPELKQGHMLPIDDTGAVIRT